MSKLDTCWNCKRERRIQQLGMCDTCRRAYTRAKDDPDWQYKVWLRAVRDPEKERANQDALDWIMDRADRHWERQADMARETGVSDRAIRRYQRGDKVMSTASCQKIAKALGLLHEFDEMNVVVGVPGWSDRGEFCGDGSAPYDGCGTFFHDHYRDGLCAECYSREVLGEGPEVARDVRVVNAG